MNRILVLALCLAPSLARAAPAIQQSTLPNGLTVLVVEDHALPLVTVEIAARNGALTESPAYNGLSHLYEHMFFKANAALPTQEAYLARARQLGIVWNGWTQTERVNYFVTTTSDHLDDAMTFMRDAIVSPRFDPKELDRERVVVTGELDRDESSPSYFLWHETDQRVWWKYPSYKDPLGNRQTVLKATVAQMTTIQHRYYVPNNSALVVTGDVKAAQLFAAAAQLYGGWKRGDDPFVKHPLVKHPPLPKSEVVLVEKPVENVSGLFEWHGPSTAGPSAAVTYAADVAGNAMLEPSSRFQRDLVDSGACVMARFSWLTQVNTGPITLAWEASPAQADACVRAILAELPKLRAPDYFSDDELANSKQHIAVERALEREKPSELAHALTFWWTSAGLDYYNGYLARVNAVQRADLPQFFDGYLTRKPFVLGVMVSPAMAHDQHLDKAHFETVAAVGK